MSVDLTKVAVGTFANFGGQPVDSAKSQIYDRAGLPADAQERETLMYVHASAQGKAVPRLPGVFPPANLPPGTPLSSAQDYLDLIDRTPQEFIPTAAEAEAERQAQAADAAAAQTEAEEAQAKAAQAEADAEAAERVAADTKAAAEPAAESGGQGDGDAQEVHQQV